MADVQVSLSILIDGLEYKERLLIDLEALTKEQENLLKKDEFDEVAFEVIVEEKAQLLDELSVVDDGFQITYDRLRGVLHAHPDYYLEQVEKMQELIRRIGDLSVSIQVSEKRNDTLLRTSLKRKNTKTQELKPNAKLVTDYYKKMNPKK